MAKLNEQPPVVDPLEILRRRFLRQNRDIARDNSTKSLRIRNLEDEVSRLLAENLSYREQVKQLQNEQGTCYSQRILDHVNDTKVKLEAQMHEIGNLVASLSNQPKRPPPRKAVDIGIPTAETTSPGKKNWRNTCMLNEALTTQDGRLPPIMEDKQYPRRTMDGTEIRETFASAHFEVATDSPEIGPPPISSFMTEDPVKLDLPKASQPILEHEEVVLNPVLSVNLEQRRKRRESIANGEHRRAGRFEAVSMDERQAFRAGAKRKIGVRDEDNDEDGKGMEDAPRPLATSHEDGMPESQLLSRIELTKDDPPDKSSDKGQASHQVSLKAPKMETTTKVVTVSRRPLGYKSANVDIANSPRKNYKVYGGNDGYEKLAAVLPRENSETKNKSKPEINLIESANLIQKGTIDIQQSLSVDEPETPAAGTLFSPTSSQPSITRASSRDTPPPTEMGEADVQRPSRRSRASVSYVQPNLRDKMRRPTKELVDAVDPVLRQRQGSNDPVSAAQGLVQSMSTKTELVENESWKQLPSTKSLEAYSKSPLGSRSTFPQDPSSSTVTHRPKQKSTPSTDQLSNGRGSNSNSRVSTAASLSCVKEPASSLREEQHIPAVSAKSDVYEFQASPATNLTASPERELSSRTKPSRRQSALSQNGRVQGEKGPLVEAERSSSSNRRRQSTIDSAVSVEDSHALVQRFGQSIRRSNSSSVRSSAMRAKGSDGTLERRRSMML